MQNSARIKFTIFAMLFFIIFTKTIKEGKLMAIYVSTRYRSLYVHVSSPECFTTWHALVYRNWTELCAKVEFHVAELHRDEECLIRKSCVALPLRNAAKNVSPGLVVTSRFGQFIFRDFPGKPFIDQPVKEDERVRGVSGCHWPPRITARREAME